MRGYLRREAAILAVLVGLGACQLAGPGEPQPVPECQAYERELASCTGTTLPVATQPAVMASSEADRTRLKAMCSDNLARLKRACR